MRIRLWFWFIFLVTGFSIIALVDKIDSLSTPPGMTGAIAPLVVMMVVAIIVATRIAFVYGIQAALPVIRRGDILKVHYLVSEKDCGYTYKMLVCQFVVGHNRGRLTKVPASELNDVRPEEAIGHHICQLATGLELYTGVAASEDTARPPDLALSQQLER